jgi:hypothetical protein
MLIVRAAAAAGVIPVKSRVGDDGSRSTAMINQSNQSINQVQLNPSTAPADEPRKKRE